MYIKYFIKFPKVYKVVIPFKFPPVVFLFNFSCTNEWIIVSQVVLTVFLMINDVDYLSMCLLTTYIDIIL